MSTTLVNKLLSSFDDLERCIAYTREALCAREGVPADVLDRVEQYAGIVEKQRSLTRSLRALISVQAWDEVARHVKLINGLSALIRDDAQEILSGSAAACRKSRGNPASELLS